MTPIRHSLALEIISTSIRSEGAPVRCLGPEILQSGRFFVGSGLTIIRLLLKVLSMVVGLDIDGVVADFLPPFLRYVEKRIGNGPIPVDAVTDLSFKEHPYLSEKIIEECMVAVSYDPDFWRDLSPLLSLGEWRALDILNRKGQLVFITHRYERETYDIHQVTCDWLKRHGIGKPAVHFTQESKANLVENLGVGLFADDRYENCQEVAEKTQAMVLMPHRLYNQSFTHPRVKRIWNFSDLFAYLRKARLDDVGSQ